MKNEHASELGKLGGVARAKKLTPARRSEIARKAAQARWKPRLFLRKDAIALAMKDLP